MKTTFYNLSHNTVMISFSNLNGKTFNEELRAKIFDSLFESFDYELVSANDLTFHIELIPTDLENHTTFKTKLELTLSDPFEDTLVMTEHFYFEKIKSISLKRVCFLNYYIC